jgi:hypothetical protein
MNWLIKKLSKYFVTRSDYDDLRKIVVLLERRLIQVETISSKQSELLSALAGIQSDLVITVGDSMLAKDEKENLYIEKFILSIPDDDDLIN